MEAPYNPIDCDFHDQLLSYATLRRRCNVTYRDDRGQAASAESLIQDVYTRDDAEYMKLENGTVIRLDRLMTVEPAQA